MSWSFTHHSKDKVALRNQCQASLTNTLKYFSEQDREKAERLMVPVYVAIDAVLDAARMPQNAYCLKVESSGHVDDNQCYFGVTIVPVYLPELIENYD